jgi:exopolyphosphatase/guanosine-5'-triphosphate,3'-diphosphate pyrophosphatase
MVHLAAIDVGSNAIRMAVARVTAPDQIEVIENVRAPVRLGSDTFTAGQISEPTMQAAVDAFIRFRKVVADFSVGPLRAVGTSALREARNSDVLVDRIARETGVAIEVISGEEEARLIHLAVGRALDLRDRCAILVDIGGGSVEVTLSEDDAIISSESYRMGTVRLLKKFDEAASSRPSFTRLVRDYAEATRRRIDHEIDGKEVHICIGTGGNLEEMGELRKQLFKRDSARVITVRELADLIEVLEGMTVQERITELGLRPDRADVIVPACLVMHSIARMAAVKEIQIPGVGLKDGILWDLVSQQESPRLPHRDQVWSAAVRLGEKYQFDPGHGQLVSRLAAGIFDQTEGLHGLHADDRLVLEVAALLHDVGHFINAIDHDRHGHYILKNNFLFGLTERQQAVIANIVRYHRKTAPTLEHHHYSDLPPKDRLLVTKLAALLRLADGIDTSHTGRVRDVRIAKVKNRWSLVMDGEGDLALEKWTLKKRRTLFQDVFGVELLIT